MTVSGILIQPSESLMIKTKPKVFNQKFILFYRNFLNFLHKVKNRDKRN